MKTPEERIAALESAVSKLIWTIRHGTFVNKGLADLTFEGRQMLFAAEKAMAQTQETRQSED